MVDIECLACGKVVQLPQYIDTDDYDGQVVCQECQSILQVKFKKGKVRKYKIIEKTSPLPQATMAMFEEVARRNTAPQPVIEGEARVS